MHPTHSASLRQTVYALLITVAAGSVAGRILITRPGPMPTHGANDRSRWDTVRALVDHGTYVIGHRDIDPALGASSMGLLASPLGQGPVLATAALVPGRTNFIDRGIITEEGWETIDKVLRPDTQDFYSSKPPLLPTLVAGEYWLLKHCFGWSITEHPWEVVRTILLTVNGLLFILYLIFLARLVEQFGTSDWGRLYVLAAGCFATFLSSFANTLNNHTVAACCALFALYPLLQIWYRGMRGVHLFLAAGFFAAFTAVNELPATSLAAMLLFLLLLKAPVRTLLLSVPAAALPVAAALWTNYFAIGQLRPAYGEFGGPWYEYEGSHWKIDPSLAQHGIDWAYQTESRAVYALHVLIGHHGIFSLTPIFLLTAAGMIYGLLKWSGRNEQQPQLTMVALLTLVVSVVVVGFYIGIVPDRNRNYGGWTSGLRWLFWLTPLWLVSMLPVADWLAARRWGRGLAYLLLGISVFSTSYPAWNPWRHPWLYDFMQAHGWIHY